MDNGVIIAEMRSVSRNKTVKPNGISIRRQSYRRIVKLLTTYKK